MRERTEAEIVSGTITVRIGKVEKSLPIRTIERSREWKRSLARALAGGDGIGKMDLATAEDGGAVAVALGDRLLDLVVEYDETAALGGREWVAANGTDAEVYAIFRELLELSFPFAGDLRTAIAELRALGLADLLAGALASSGRSPKESDTSDSSASSDSGLLVASSKS